MHLVQTAFEERRWVYLVQAYMLLNNNLIKDGAYYCYCAYALRISRYSGFLWVVPTNIGIFLRGLKLCRENRT